MAMSEWLENHSDNEKFEDDGWEFFGGCLRKPIFEKKSKIQRFTAYRRSISLVKTHNELQKNPDDKPQFEGVIWTDGTVTLRWLTAIPSTSVWKSVGDCLNIHGHPEYDTYIVWHDGEAPKEWTIKLDEYRKKLDDIVKDSYI